MAQFLEKNIEETKILFLIHTNLEILLSMLTEVIIKIDIA